MTDSGTREGGSGKSFFYGWWFPANLVTFARIVLVVAYIAMTVAAGPRGEANLTLRWVTAVLFIVAASTDKVDGWLARSRGEVTELGKLMDPIADKLLMCSALVIFAAFGEYAFGWVIAVLFLIREVGITVMRFFVMERPGGKVIAAAWPGKLKTVFQSVSLSMFMLPFWSLGPSKLIDAYYVLAYVLLVVALVLCLYSGFKYVAGVVGGPQGGDEK